MRCRRASFSDFTEFGGLSKARQGGSCWTPILHCVAVDFDLGVPLGDRWKPLASEARVV